MSAMTAHAVKFTDSDFDTLKKIAHLKGTNVNALINAYCKAGVCNDGQQWQGGATKPGRVKKQPNP